MSRESFFDIFVDLLKDTVSAEFQILDAFPKLISAAFSSSLKDAFKKHKAETQNQVKRLKTIFQKLNLSPGNVVCFGMKGLMHEAESIIHHNAPSAVEDSALIAIAQKIEHYEIAAYGTLRSFARHLELDDIANLLDESLEEEGDANSTLTKLAEGSLFTSGINDEALREKASPQPKAASRNPSHKPIRTAIPRSRLTTKAAAKSTTRSKAKTSSTTKRKKELVSH